MIVKVVGDDRFDRAPAHLERNLIFGMIESWMLVSRALAYVVFRDASLCCEGTGGARERWEPPAAMCFVNKGR